MQDLFTIYTFIIYGLIVLVIEGIKKLIIHNNQIELEKIQLNIIKEKDNINRLFVFENKIQKKIIKYDIFNHIILFLIIVLYCYFYKTWSLNFILFDFILFSYLKTKIINLLNLKNYYDNYIMEYNFFQSF